MTHQYFADCQNDLYAKNSDAVCVYVSQKDDSRDASRDDSHNCVDNSVDWIPLSEFSGKVNNRKNGHAGRPIVAAFRQLKDRYWTHTENLTMEDDSSGLLADNVSDDDPC